MTLVRERSLFDAVVVGAGLSGLTAAICLQKSGMRTVVLERRSSVGGLCGTFELDGHRFVLGCNDFGAGLERTLRGLGVEVDFMHPGARFYLGEHRVDLPPTASTAMKFFARPLSVARALIGAKKDTVRSLGDLLDGHVSDPLLRDFVAVLAWAVLRSPDDVELSALKELFDKRWDYGYDRASTPVGGPQHMVDRMAARFQALGGELLLDCVCHGHERARDGHVIETSLGTFESELLFSSHGRWNDYPAQSRAGLEAAAVFFALDPSLRYPEGVHTIGCFERGTADALRALDRGERSSVCSFHVFRSDLAEPAGAPWTITGFVPVARGVRTMDEGESRALLEAIGHRLERVMPGFSQAVRYQRALSPAEYEARFGFAPLASPRIAPEGFARPPTFDAASGVYWLGNSAGPPGDHAGAAVLSGRLAAEHAIERRASRASVDSRMAETQHAH